MKRNYISQLTLERQEEEKLLIVSDELERNLYDDAPDLKTPTPSYTTERKNATESIKTAQEAHLLFEGWQLPAKGKSAKQLAHDLKKGVVARVQEASSLCRRLLKLQRGFVKLTEAGEPSADQHALLRK